ncbi:hypothetical protein BASA50_010768 [Batrachochytrium salamandrivorans]|uniref:Uncharacterized protein n=1 Tax=Batrachochytrium salamandrivorans TaxID=1357716 RepID=A0ABQ8F0Q1_9FUNG|nr:hypothetical protein BASA50_010768 [Batrachochytrium salamandrivorans]
MAEVPVESGLLLLDVVERLGLAGVVVVVIVVVVVCSVQSKICTRVSLIACSSCVSTRAKNYSGVGAIYHQVGHGLAVQVSMTEYTQAGTAQLVGLPPTVQPPKTRLWLPSQTPPLLLLLPTTTTTGQPSKDTRFADAVKRRPTHQQLVERQPEFRKAGAAAWLALKRETSVPAHSAPKWSSPRVSDSFMQAVSLR